MRRVACDLIPLAVLKLKHLMIMISTIDVACDLIPLAVLKLHLALDHAHQVVTVACDLIPLAVCPTKREPFGSLFVCLLRSRHRFQWSHLF